MWVGLLSSSVEHEWLTFCRQHKAISSKVTQGMTKVLMDNKLDRLQLPKPLHMDSQLLKHHMTHQEDMGANSMVSNSRVDMVSRQVSYQSSTCCVKSTVWRHCFFMFWGVWFFCWFFFSKSIKWFYRRTNDSKLCFICSARR